MAEQTLRYTVEVDVDKAAPSLRKVIDNLDKLEEANERLVRSYKQVGGAMNQLGAAFDTLNKLNERGARQDAVKQRFAALRRELNAADRDLDRIGATIAARDPLWKRLAIGVTGVNQALSLLDRTVGRAGRTLVGQFSGVADEAERILSLSRRFDLPVEQIGRLDFVGLTFDAECIQAACKALQEQGTGTTGSRMAYGTFAGHVALERELADYFGCRGAIVFSTGYVANLGMLSALAQPGDVILLDADCHASIYDGCRLGGAEVIRFRHNDVSDLGKRLRRLGDRAANALILVEGIDSMLGDRAPLKEIAAVKRQYGACLLVDEAHSVVVLGNRGRGLAEEVGGEESVDFIVGTFRLSLIQMKSRGS